MRSPKVKLNDVRLALKWQSRMRALTPQKPACGRTPGALLACLPRHRAVSKSGSKLVFMEGPAGLCSVRWIDLIFLGNRILLIQYGVGVTT